MTIFFVVLFCVILVIFVLARFSYLKIDVQKLKMMNNKLIDFKFVISLAFLNKINIIKLTINKERILKFKKNNLLKRPIRKIQKGIVESYDNIKEIKKEAIKNYLRVLKKVEIEDVDMDINIGTESAPLTAAIVTFISLAITFFVVKESKNRKYKVVPVYNNRNYLSLSIKCIISIKLVHIISITKILKRKDRGKVDGRAFNRRTYANRYG